MIVNTNRISTNINDNSSETNVIDEFFENSISDLDKKLYIKSLIPRAGNNILEYLMTLTEYDCTYAEVISDNVIGGITKNGNDIKVVARPSDVDKIRIYYDSEFDVLENDKN